MNIDPKQIRKAAILVATLDTATADALLDAFPEDAARRIRDAVIAIDTIDPAEQAEVIAEFMREQSPEEVEVDGVELQLSSEANEAEALSTENTRDSQRASPFAFLHSADAEELIALVRHERPQTIALVLAYLPREQAVEVLTSLSPELQADVVRRVATLDRVDSAAMQEIERVLESRVTIKSREAQAQGVKAVKQLLERADQQTAGMILENVARRDPKLARRIAPPVVTLDDVEELDDVSQAAVLAVADIELARLAVLAWDPDRAKRVAAHLPVQKRRAIQKTADLGPVAIRDLEDAQVELLELARELLANGQIDGPERVPLRMAA